MVMQILARSFSARNPDYFLASHLQEGTSEIKEFPRFYGSDTFSPAAFREAFPNLTSLLDAGQHSCFFPPSLKLGIIVKTLCPFDEAEIARCFRSEGESLRVYQPLCTWAMESAVHGASDAWGRLPGSWRTETGSLSLGTAFQRAEKVSDCSKNLRRHEAGKRVKSVMGALSWGWSEAASQTGGIRADT